MLSLRLSFVIPAQAGIQENVKPISVDCVIKILDRQGFYGFLPHAGMTCGAGKRVMWIPAFAGMTERKTGMTVRREKNKRRNTNDKRSENNKRRK